MDLQKEDECRRVSAYEGKKKRKDEAASGFCRQAEKHSIELTACNNKGVTGNPCKSPDEGPLSEFRKSSWFADKQTGHSWGCGSLCNPEQAITQKVRPRTLVEEETKTVLC